MHMYRSIGLRLVVLAALALIPRAAAQEQEADEGFDASVAKPAYTTDGPKVLFDEAHRNFHTANGRYKPFADLIQNDGYRIVPPTKRKITKELLAEYQIMVIANPVGVARQADPAFTDSECDAIRDWVREGGSLLLIADHYPMGHAAESLAQRFDVSMSKGMTDEYSFNEGQGLNMRHPIMRGRSAEEQVRNVRTFTGQSLRGPAGGASLLTLPPGAKEMVPDTQNPADEAKAKRRPVVYPDQGVALAFGKGRVVVLGEAAMLSAQISAGEKFGMNVPGIDNRQLALNSMHWLSGLLPAE